MTKAKYDLLRAFAKKNGMTEIINGSKEKAVKTKGKYNRITIRAVDGAGVSYYSKFNVED